MPAFTTLKAIPKGHYFADDTFTDIFVTEGRFIVIEFHRIFFVGDEQAPSYFLNQFWQSSVTLYGVPGHKQLKDIMPLYIITVASQWARWRLKSPASILFVEPCFEARIKENLKAPRDWPLWGEFPAQMASNAEKCFHLMTTSWSRHNIFSAISFNFSPLKASTTFPGWYMIWNSLCLLLRHGISR